ncbi:hypothetical protein SGGMMB4_00043 [Sodalis glossinidius str. 'morsitans']|uniref:Uncharacterized protein n=1 Tax=Sodalis glossinidius (strain morsitans) TaxID=343509 RepID=A0A193QEN2_SODGM|nr:hypothetical protein SGGMMB4_00043 [Sodalis glossinidius str. 'morsitans']
MTRHNIKIALFLMMAAAGLAGTSGVASAVDSGTGNASASSAKGIGDADAKSIQAHAGGGDQQPAKNRDRAEFDKPINRALAT